MLLNNDAFLAPDALARFEAVFCRQPRAAVVAGQLLDGEGRPQRSAGYTPRALDELGLGFLRRRPRAPVTDGLTEVEAVVGACMTVRAAAIRDAGSLDNDFFFYFEETEWCHRFRRHGWQVLVVAVWVGVVAWQAPGFLPWIAPVALGLLLAAIRPPPAAGPV